MTADYALALYKFSSRSHKEQTLGFQCLGALVQLFVLIVFIEMVITLTGESKSVKRTFDSPAAFY
jgi:hypothetical protein